MDARPGPIKLIERCVDIVRHPIPTRWKYPPAMDHEAGCSSGMTLMCVVLINAMDSYGPGTASSRALDSAQGIYDSYADRFLRELGYTNQQQDQAA